MHVMLNRLLIAERYGHVAFVTDVNSRLIVGWQTFTSLYTNLALDALNMGI